MLNDYYLQVRVLIANFRRNITAGDRRQNLPFLAGKGFDHTSALLDLVEEKVLTVLILGSQVRASSAKMW